jgi:hypothetical protein
LENKFALVSAEEEQRVGRSLLVWLNYCPDKPVGRINFEFLPTGSAGMMMSTIQAAIKTRQYITGGYEAQYQFRLVYRAYPDDNDSRLAADEALSAIGVWAERSVSGLVLDGASARSVKRNSNASLLAAYDDGSRDHQILMTLTYEVI